MGLGVLQSDLNVGAITAALTVLGLQRLVTAPRN
jgi:hypothetical protein